MQWRRWPFGYTCEIFACPLPRPCPTAHSALVLVRYRVKKIQRRFRKHYAKTQAQAYFILLQCQREEASPQAVGESSTLDEEHEHEQVPPDILFDTICRKLYERRRAYVIEMKTYLEAQEVAENVENIRRLVTEREFFGAKDVNGETISPGMMLWFIVKLQRR